MNVNVTDLEKNEKELSFSLTPADMERFLDSAAKRLSKDMKIKGFREGSVPRNVVESTLGREKVWHEASSEAIEESFINAIREHNIEPIGRPRVEVLKLVPDNDFEFKAIVPISPEVTLPDYKGIAKKINKEKKEVTVEEKEIEETLKMLQRSRAQQEMSEEDKKDTDGKDADKKAASPSKSSDGDSSGQALDEKLPELNDEFAKNLGNFENLEALKKSVGDGIKKEKEHTERERIRIKVLEEIGKQIKIEISDVLLQNELDKMQEEFTGQIASMGMQTEEYLKNIKKTWKEVREGWADRALQRIMAALLLREIADAEDIEPDVSTIEEESEKYLRQHGSIEEAKKSIDPEALRLYIRGILRNEKVLELLEEA